MEKELLKKNNMQEVELTESQAMARFDEAKTLLNFNRPATYEYNKPFDELFDVIHALVVMPTTLTSIAIGSLMNIPIGLPLLYSFIPIVLSSSFIAIFYSIRSHNGNPKQKIRHLLSKIFLSQKQKMRVKECHEKNVASKNSWDLYRLLVRKVHAELEDEGVFQAVNHSEQSTFIHITDTGYCQKLSLQDWNRQRSSITAQSSIDKSIIGYLSQGKSLPKASELALTEPVIEFQN